MNTASMSTSRSGGTGLAGSPTPGEASAAPGGRELFWWAASSALLLLAFAPCPTGWGYDPSRTPEVGRLAVRTGVWPLKEYVDGRVVHTKVRRPRLPVERYLERQRRFAHLFEPVRNEALLARIQADVDAYWKGIE